VVEQQKTIADSELAKVTEQLQSIKGATPSLDIHWFPKPPYLREKESTYYCLLGVKNRSRTATAQNVKLELLSIIDTLPNAQQPNRAALRLPCTDDTNTINPESTIYFELFLVNCDPFHRTVSITDSQRKNYQFDARQFGADMLSEAHLTAAMLTFHSYSLEIKVSATGCSPITQKFRLNFPLDEPVVDLTPVN